MMAYSRTTDRERVNSKIGILGIENNIINSSMFNSDIVPNILDSVDLGACYVDNLI